MQDGIAAHLERAAVHEDGSGQVAVEVVLLHQQPLGVHAVDAIPAVGHPVATKLRVGREREEDAVASVSDGVSRHHSARCVAQGDRITAHLFGSRTVPCEVDAGGIDLATGGVQFVAECAVCEARDGVADDMCAVGPHHLDSHVYVGDLDVLRSHVVGEHAQPGRSTQRAFSTRHQAQAAHGCPRSSSVDGEYRAGATTVEDGATFPDERDTALNHEVAEVAAGRQHNSVAGLRRRQPGSQFGTGLCGRDIAIVLRRNGRRAGCRLVGAVVLMLVSSRGRRRRPRADPLIGIGAGATGNHAEDSGQ